MKIRGLIFAVCILCLTFDGFAGDAVVNPLQDYYAQPAADPLEGFNRCMEGFNAGCAKYVVRPVGSVYTFVMPEFVRDGIGNFADNLQFPLSLVNNCLQGKFDGAWNETKRFGINTTVGILGIRDQATAWGIPARQEDFGQTFGYYGSGPWFYLNLPLLGPSSGRDCVGMILGIPFNIANYIFGDYSIFVKMGAAGNDALSNSDMLNEYFTTRYDTYELTRAAFLCYRDAQIADFAFTPTGEKVELEESMGYVLLNTSDKHFDWKSDHGSVQLAGAVDKLPYTVWLPKKRDGRLLFLLPGIGSHRESKAMQSLAEPFVAEGWTVAAVSNTYAPDYFLHTRDTHLPGRPSRDCLELEKALALVRADVEKRFLKKSQDSQKTVLMGFSLGAINTLHLAARAQRKESSFVCDRYVAVNPPVDPQYALQRIDDYFDIPLSWPEEIRGRRVKETLGKIAGLLQAEGDGASLDVPLTLDESRFIIGMNIRLTLANLLVACREKFAPPEMLRNPKTADLAALKHRALDVSYREYIEKMLLKDGEDIMAMAATERLTTLEDALKAADNVFIMHNRNDFLMKPEDFAWIENTFGSRAILFPKGGHLGSLYLPEIRKVLVNTVISEK